MKVVDLRVMENIGTMQTILNDLQNSLLKDIDSESKKHIKLQDPKVQKFIKFVGEGAFQVLRDVGFDDVTIDRVRQRLIINNQSLENIMIEHPNCAPFLRWEAFSNPLVKIFNDARKPRGDIVLSGVVKELAELGYPKTRKLGGPGCTAFDVGRLIRVIEEVLEYGNLPRSVSTGLLHRTRLGLFRIFPRKLRGRASSFDKSRYGLRCLNGIVDLNKIVRKQQQKEGKADLNLYHPKVQTAIDLLVHEVCKSMTLTGIPINIRREVMSALGKKMFRYEDVMAECLEFMELESIENPLIL
ncbi:hypothetical protein BMR07_15820 [Methylococcaceae bacterium CS1]|nr:hypothetical protein BMR11_16625 [Methylococcaceae bacterium CS5]TXK93802.1 hypothetical protein BMR10_14925 [Methylococcaceae bacterium CS4]TXL03231.1 hypothetical protein BMR07_15820 [Methylococcaceae bacterium CS1]TXL03240.1 hypothetical protein BMR09_15310 [Methylococcaceae bacterium CS3]TXL07339.1 hypothetical protein BMR08_14910 [Methylococcaceae bacterium CS2]